MKNFFQKQREMVALLAYAAIIAVIVYFVILPLMEKISSINYQIQEEKMKQEIIKRNIANLPKIQEQYEILQHEEDLTRVLLDKNKAVLLIEKLEKLAQQTGSEIAIEAKEAVDPKKKNKTAAENVLVNELPSPDYLQLKITLIGRYESVMNFIEALERFEYYSDIVSLQINEDESSVQIQSNKVTTGGNTQNPFSVIEDRGLKNSSSAKSDKLAASLETVFYMKQN